MLGNDDLSARLTTSVDHESTPFLCPDIELQDSDRVYKSHVPTDELRYSSDGWIHNGNAYEPDLRTHTFESVNASQHGEPSWPMLLSCGGDRGRKRSRIIAPNRYRRTRTWRIRLLHNIWRAVAALFILLGILQVATLVLDLVAAFVPEKLDHAYKTWREQEDLGENSRWPTDYTADITPVACHSHNDYWRRIPLTSAVKAGCTGVEADVWLVDNDLYVGHKESALTPTRTLSTLYIDPLRKLLDRQNPSAEPQKLDDLPRNGVFDTDATQTLVLLIDFKTRFEDLWPIVSLQLDPLRKRQYLTYFNGTDVVQGPVTVVVTGNAPFDYVVSNMTFRDMFFDAPLDLLAALNNSKLPLAYDASLELDFLTTINTTSKTNEDQNQGQGHSGHQPTNPAIFTPANSYYASVNFGDSIGWPRPYLSSTQREKIAAQIAGAHAQGLKVRYWGTPNWPIGLRNYLWRELVKMGIDYLNVDDLQAATKGDWRSGHNIWDWSLWGGRDW